jgi:hypothetical protein
MGRVGCSCLTLAVLASVEGTRGTRELAGEVAPVRCEAPYRGTT